MAYIVPPREARIELQFVQGTGFSSALIEWFSAGRYSHVDAVLPDGSLLGARSDWITVPKGLTRAEYVIPSGVQIRPADYESWRRTLRMSVPCTEAQHDWWLSFLREQIGKPYDMPAIWGFAAGRDWRERDSWFCSELQAMALEVAGVVPPLIVATSKITPVALALVMSALHHQAH